MMSHVLRYVLLTCTAVYYSNLPQLTQTYKVANIHLYCYTFVLSCCQRNIYANQKAYTVRYLSMHCRPR